jgi:MinD-like ATPase involved in chromosome partitioning or flagellar assembly
MNTAEPEVALVLSPEEWVERLHRHCADHGGARVRQVVMDPALALEDQYSTLIVSSRWPALSPAFVDALHKRGRTIVGVYDPAEPPARDRLSALGVDSSIAADADVHDFVRAIEEVAPRRAIEGTSTGSGGPRAVPRAGRLVAVGGPAGSGATELAIGLADAMAAGRRVLLVDADEATPSVSPRLGLPIEPNLRSAIDAVEFGLGSLTRTLLPVPGAAFGVLGGLPNVAAWAQVLPSEVVLVAEAVGRFADEIVINVGHCLEDVGGERGRYSISRALLTEADVVIAVGPATPVGASRLLEWLAAARTLTGSAPVVVAVNRAPKGRYRRAELVTEITRTFEPVALRFIPEDRRVRHAAWDGRTVPRGAFTRAVQGLVRELDAIPAGRRQRVSGA